MPTTWVRMDRRISHDSDCLLCGIYYGICQGEHRVHRPATCKACGTPQCWTNGMARGTCRVCLVGLLDNFSGHDRPCGYKGCGKEGVALAPRVGRVCKDHLSKAKVDLTISKALAERSQSWEERKWEYAEFPKK